MNILFSVVLLILVMMFYLSNPRNKVNKWCAFGGFMFWLGVAKEAVLYNVIPMFDNAENIAASFMPLYSIFTWMLYSFAMPTVIIAALYFCNLHETRLSLLRVLRFAVYIPAIVFSFFFPPLAFRDYQLTSLAFWIVYAVHNLAGAAVYTWLLCRSVHHEKQGEERRQKKRVVLVILPPVVFWAVSVFLTHPFEFSGLFNLWQINAVILLAGLGILVVMTFRDGFMGLKLSKENYDWNTDIDLIGRGADYWGHMMKNQTSKMELCVDELKKQYADSKNPEELAILSRSIDSIKNYMSKIKRHSQNIVLREEQCNLRELLNDAIAVYMPVSRVSKNITINANIPDDIFWHCDKSHITEVFSNIISNAVEAIRGGGVVTIVGELTKKHYALRFTDTGAGVDKTELRKIFEPFFTTKSTEKNFGLGLAYCKNVVMKHEGGIYAESELDKGTTITITLPLKRVICRGEKHE
ncbi:MAG: HAMP domain-containing histidine kinase [Oscillospiraceae bacterium]|nr:HAMP domain-containing histidine kinase [Oscillospiraceae bacterium]